MPAQNRTLAQMYKNLIKPTQESKTPPIEAGKPCQAPILRGGDFRTDAKRPKKIQPEGLDKDPPV